MPLSPREQKILELASREVDPRHAHEFAPITHGFVFACLGIVFLGTLGVLLMAARKLAFWKP